MDAYPVDRTEEVFLEALDLSGSQRLGYLDQVCRHDDSLRERVERLLAEHDRAASYFDSLEASLFGSRDDVRPPPSDPYQLVGGEVSHYRVDGVAGSGGMGIVYRAFDTRLQRTVALKFLPPDLNRDSVAVSRFLREARAASALDHPNVCPVYEVGEREGCLFIAMAYCEGETLRERMARDRIPISEALHIARQLASGLAYAHEQGIVHRDVKPGNAALDDRGRVRLLDFGLARLSDQTQLSTTGAAVGTVAYMSPEQISGAPVDARSDVWSAGVLLYEMLAGAKPFRGDRDTAVLHNILYTTPRPIRSLCPEVPSELQEVVARCLARDPGQRFADGADLLAALEGVSNVRRGERSRRIVTSGRRSLTSTLLRPGGITWRRPAALAMIAVLVVLLVWVLYDGSGFGTETADAAGAVPRLAVLPFEAESDVETAMLYDGLSASISRHLEELQADESLRFHVVPSAEVRSNDVATPVEAGRVLGADLAARVRARASGRGVELTLTIINTRSRGIVARDSMHFASLDPRAIQRRLAARIASRLGGREVVEESTLLATFDALSDDALEHYLKGLALLDRPDRESGVEGAIEHFETALTEDPRFARAYEGLCEAYWYMFEHARDKVFADAALSNCGRALELQPDLTGAHVRQALVLDGVGRHEQALTSVARALDRDASNAEAHRVRGRILSSMGESDRAEAAFLTAISLDNRSWRAFSSLGNLYMRTARYGEALATFEHIPTIAPDFLWGYVNLGAAQLNAGRLADARKTWETARAIREDYDVLSNLGTTLFLERKFDAAAEVYEDALELDDRKYSLWGNLATAYHWAPGMQEKALPAYERAAEMARKQMLVTPDDPPLLLHLASYEVRLGMQEQAAERVHRATELEPDDVYVMFAAADVYEQLGQRKRALEWLDKALEAGFPIFWIEENVWFDSLRQDPEYRTLMAN